MTTSKSHLEQLLSKMYANSFRKNNQKGVYRLSQTKIK